MADVSAARTKAVFEFKSATLPLIAVILKTSDLDVLAEALDFFEQEPVVIDLSQLPEQDEDGEAVTDLDFAALRSLLARHQTQPIAVRGGNASQNAAACRWPRCRRHQRPAPRRHRPRHRPPRPPRSCAKCRCRPTAPG